MRKLSAREKLLGNSYAGIGEIKVVSFSGRENADFGIWGSIAEQLGKKEFFKDYYSPLKAPGEKSWVELLKGHKTLILLDELPPYLENAKSIMVGNSDLSKVTMTAMDSDELRSMYANLIAKSMVKDTSDMVHPGFVEIIKQLSPIDAVILKKICSRQVNPYIEVVRKLSTGGGVGLIAYLTYDSLTLDTHLVDSSITNLERLGLISANTLSSYTHKQNYDLLKSSEIFLKFKAEFEVIPQSDGLIVTVEPIEGLIAVTPFGRDFSEVCLSD